MATKITKMGDGPKGETRDGLAVRNAAIAAALKEFPVDGNKKDFGGKSSNASLGIDPTVALGGKVKAASNSLANGGGNVGQKERKASLDDNYGAQGFSARKGTQGAREDMTIGPAADRGEFGTSAKSGGHAEGSTSSTFGAGSRNKGTAGGDSGTPGQTGSMAAARRGLNSGNKG